MPKLPAQSVGRRACRRLYPPSCAMRRAIHSTSAVRVKPEVFDRVIQALVFTVIVQVTVTVISIKEDLIPVLSVLIAVVLALATVYWSNNDFIRRILRRFNVTKETSYPSQWYSTFWRLGGCYVVLHLKGEHRLYG